MPYRSRRWRWLRGARRLARSVTVYLVAIARGRRSDALSAAEALARDIEVTIEESDGGGDALRGADTPLELPRPLPGRHGGKRE